MSAQYLIATEINGVRHYIKRNRYNKHGFIAVTLLTTSATKAKKFNTVMTLPMGYYRTELLIKKSIS